MKTDTGRHQLEERQRRLATEFARFERDGLQHLEHFGSGSVLKAPPVDRSAEEEFGGSVEQNPTRCH